MNPDMQTRRFNTRDMLSRSSKQGHPNAVESSSPLVATQSKVFSSNRPNTSGQELQFITTTGPPSERSQTSRYIVRSHVRRSFLLEKNRESLAGPKPDAQIEVINIIELKGRFKLATWTKRKRKQPKKAYIAPEKTSQRAVSSSRYDRRDPKKPGFRVCRHLCYR